MVEAGVGNPEQVISAEGHRPELKVSAAEVVYRRVVWGTMGDASGMEE